MINLIVRGQGIFIFSIFPSSFTLLNDIEDDGLNFYYENSTIYVHRIKGSAELLKKSIEHRGGEFFFSINANTSTVHFGFGEARNENILSSYTFDSTNKLLNSITKLSSNQKVKIIKDPIKGNVPLLIKKTDDLTMEDIATDKYMPTSYLSPVCLQLYNCISGKKFVLNTPDFPDFSKAIDYSINTPGLWCNKTLIEKSNEFGKSNIDETYLRITLGNNNGESPGIPYVMEIWPSGHYSPVHSHSSANAIIRVLRGEIDVNLYPYLGSDKEFAVQTFKKGDITWIFSNLNQIHQLKNDKKNKKCCITIQCYMYDNNDKTHYEYFDYIDSSGSVQQYKPDSDMDFILFKNIIKAEWNSRKRFTWLS